MTDALIAELLKSSKDMYEIYFLTMDYTTRTGTSGTLYLCTDTVEHEYDGHTFIPVYFDFTRPAPSDGATDSSAGVKISIVSLDVVDILMQVDEYLTLTIVAAAQVYGGAIEETEKWQLFLTEATWTRPTLTAKLTPRTYMDTKVPGFYFDSVSSPGMYL